MDLLSVKQVADLKGCTPRNIQKLINEKKIKAVKEMNAKNRPEYKVPVTELEEELQQKWYHSQGFTDVDDGDEVSKSLESYTEAEREEIAFWLHLIEKWEEYRAKPGVGSKAEVDQKFVAFCELEYPNRQISVKTLYRKKACIGKDDMDGLIDKRGKSRRGSSSIDETIWQAFLYYYLDESQHPIKKCMEYATMWAQEKRPDLVDGIPSYSSFRRKIEYSVMEYEKILGREGEKAFRDRCAPFIRRTYDDMQSNEWWIADNHTFDVMVRDKDGKIHRPYLTAYMDARSGIFTGYYVTYNPSSEATLIALRRGIRKYGIPENIYVDNGREFLTFDIGGLGHRKKKPKDGKEVYIPPGVFERLGIKMTNAIVRNAKAKIIERRFLDVKNDFSRLFNTFTGGTVVEKPERLKTVLKKDRIYTDEEFEQMVENIITWYFNMESYNGEVASDKGKVKMDVFNEHLVKQRRASDDELNLMLLRSSRLQKVGRRGVHLDIAGGRIDYWNDDFLQLMFGKEVYFRYDPDDLASVRIYNKEDKFIMTVPADNEAVRSYNASKDEVKIAMQKTKRFERITKEALQNRVLADCDKVTALELVLGQAARNKAQYERKANPTVVELTRAVEEPLYQKVVGEVDLDIMNKNAEKRRKR